MSIPIRRSFVSRGFTLVELLVVVGIIAVLVSILIPVVGRIKRSAQAADTQSEIAQLSNAINNYYNDFRSYPGPLNNYQVSNAQGLFVCTIATNASGEGFVTTQSPAFNTHVTMAENLVLGLLGGLRFDSTNVANPIQYDPRLVGAGPVSLNPQTPKRHDPYMDTVNLSWRSDMGKKTGQFKDDLGAADDSIIPEFVDKFGNPMPILYLRARAGVSSAQVTAQEDDNTVITFDQSDGDRKGQYDLHQILPYTGADIGVGRTKPTYAGYSTNPYHGLTSVDPKAVTLKSGGGSGSKYYYPYDAYAYFRNQSLSTPSQTDATFGSGNNRHDVPQQKDAFILISAGPDRVYGTDDDITNFGSVGK